MDPLVTPPEAALPESFAERAQRRASELLTRATERIPVLGSVVAAAQHEHASGGGLLAGGVAYRVFFWIVPLGLAAAAVASLVGIEPEAELETAAAVRGLGAVMITAERQAIDASGAGAWSQLALGLALAVWFGHGVVKALNVVFAKAWEQPIPRVRNPLLAGASFTIMATGLLTVGGRLRDAVAAIGLGIGALLVAQVVIYALSAYVIALIFPHGDAPRRALLPGCFVVGAGMVLLRVVVSVYLAPKLGNSVDTYGMLGAAVVILLWLYLVARLISVSAFLNAALWNERARRDAVVRAATPSE